ncbi:MAG: hypothetical protein VYD11_02950, partial [Actinomycetota bacterium]|nr:hypothetical protein [Actinomycetota bacterium]MEE3353654.1 hypothetical protein [Actinomycetota bacterium]
GASRLEAGDTWPLVGGLTARTAISATALLVATWAGTAATVVFTSGASSGLAAVTVAAVTVAASARFVAAPAPCAAAPSAFAIVVAAAASTDELGGDQRFLTARAKDL